MKLHVEIISKWSKSYWEAYSHSSSTLLWSIRLVQWHCLTAWSGILKLSWELTQQFQSTEIWWPMQRKRF